MLSAQRQVQDEIDLLKDLFMTMMIMMMMAFIIRPRHSPLHPDPMEALENTHSHSGTSHAPVF